MPTDNFQTARAKSLLAHYLKFGLEAAGYRWDGDNQSEVGDIVDSIIDACAQSTPAVVSTQSTLSIPSTVSPLDRIADALDRIADAQEALARTAY